MKLLGLKTLTYLNNVPFIKRGKLYKENTYQSAKTLHNLQVQFKTTDGQIVTFSDDPDDDVFIDNILVDYDKYKTENANVQKQPNN